VLLKKIKGVNKVKKYVLKNDVLYRRESFGSIIYNKTRKEFYHFNKHASEVIECFVFPLSVEEIKLKINETRKLNDVENINLQNFVFYLLDIGIISEEGTSFTGKSKAILFLPDRENIPLNYLTTPTTTALYITYKCYKKCIHCISNSDSKKREEFTKEEWFRVIDILAENGIVQVVITGGEPFCREDILDILTYIDEKELRSFLLTEASFLNELHVNKISKMRFLGDIQISMDGYNEETHDFIRGEGSFKILEKKLQLLKASKIKFTLAALMHKENYLNLDKIAKKANEFGAEKLWITPLTPFGRGKNISHLVLSDEELMILSKNYCKLIDMGLINPANDFWKLSVKEKTYLTDKEFNPLKGNPFEFSRAIYTLSIDPEGNCYVDSKSRSLNILFLGNILKNNFDDIWHNKKLEKIRENYQFGQWTFFDYLKKTEEVI
jgi:MoaA/NifB/PqqE/SkfB family radical SAM enzyme